MTGVMTATSASRRSAGEWEGYDSNVRDEDQVPARPSHDRPPGVPDRVVEGIGRASEGLEYVERAKGHLYAAHQLIGRADFLFEEAADVLGDEGLDGDAAMLRHDVVGRNVLDGRWTFQIVEEFEDCYYRPVADAVRALERDHLQGRRHVFEAEMKEQRRTRGHRGHERRPPASHDPAVEL